MTAGLRYSLVVAVFAAPVYTLMPRRPDSSITSSSSLSSPRSLGCTLVLVLLAALLKRAGLDDAEGAVWPGVHGAVGLPKVI